jgi:tRNA(Ile)-lysidine synthase
MISAIPTLNREHIRPGDRICAAVSGGADSVALLLLLHAANALPRHGLGVGLSAVHVHHGLRGEEADADLAFVEALCLRLAVPLHVHHASVPERMAASRAGAGKNEGCEEAARAIRYELFASLIAQGHADSVLTAHTLDDQAETVLMKLLRGAWTEGLSGIHPVVRMQGTGISHPSEPRPLAGDPDSHPSEPRPLAGDPDSHPSEPRPLAGDPDSHPSEPRPLAGDPDREQGTAGGQIVRPLLAVRRAELEDFLRARNQPWRTDSSNSDEAFTRNRVRHQLLPILREYNPSLDQTLANLAELAREDEARWQAELGRILPQVLLPGKPVRGGGWAVSTAAGEPASVALEIERLRGFDPALRRRVVRAAARRLCARLSFDETARLLALAGLLPDAGNGEAPPARAGAGVHLAAGLRAQRSARELRLYRVERPTGE